MNDHIIILGAGLAGLGCARALPGARIFEAQSHPGGHAWSHEAGGVYFDEGAHICHAKDPSWLEMLFRAAGDVEHIAHCRVFNYRAGQWITYPVQNNLYELSKSERETALKDFETAQAARGGRKPAHYHEWCLQQYGHYLTETFYRPYTNKYWRAPMEELATDWLGGRLLPAQVERIRAGAREPQKESQAVFARFHYPARGGFFAFFKPLFESLPVTYDMRAVEIDAKRREIVFENGRKESYEQLAGSIPLPDLIRAIPDAPSAVRDAANRLRHVQLLCVNMIIERVAASPHSGKRPLGGGAADVAGCGIRDAGYGMRDTGCRLKVGRKDSLQSSVSRLTPCHWFYIYDEDVDVSRVKVNSNVAPKSVSEGRTALQCEIFRRMDEEIPVDELAAKAVRDMGKILGFDPARDVQLVKPIHVPYAYVLSDLNRAPAVNTIIPWLESREIYPMGLFGRWQFIWSDAAYRSGEETAGRIRKAVEE